MNDPVSNRATAPTEAPTRPDSSVGDLIEQFPHKEINTLNTISEVEVLTSPSTIDTTEVKVYSIVSSVSSDDIEHLEEAAKSVLSQDVPPGWSLEWYIRVNGRLPFPRPECINDSRVFIDQHRSNLNMEAARDLAAVQADGEIIKMMKLSDVLMPGQVKRDIEVFESYPEVEWVISSVIDYLDDGSLLSHPDPDQGPLEPGSLFSFLDRKTPTIPTNPATLAVRTDLFWEVGGWSILPVPDVNDLIKILDCLGGGYFLSELSLLHRVPGNDTNSIVDQHHDELRRKLLQHRVDNISKRMDR